MLLSLSLLFAVPVFSKRGRLETATQWVFIASFILSFVALGIISTQYRLDRNNLIEDAIIPRDWLVLVVNGGLFSVLLKKQLKAGNG